MAAAISGVRSRYHMQRNRSDVLRTPHRSATARLISTESAVWNCSSQDNVSVYSGV